MTAYPPWLGALAWVSVILCLACAALIAFDEQRRPQKMKIMNLVWPLTALYMGPAALFMYRRTLRYMIKEGGSLRTPYSSYEPRLNSRLPDPTQVAVASFHCGAGCALGDLVSETLVPLLAISFAGVFGSRLLLDFVFAYGLGIAFQYFTIVPMRELSPREGLKDALRADTISIVLFQVGMFGWMALTYFVFFPAPHLQPTSVVFWFMMQIAMLAGLLTSYPANKWLLKRGWKERMPQREKQRQEVQWLRAA